MPPGQTVRCDSAEATELLWLELPRDGGLADESIIQAPPTRFSLGDLAFCLRKHGSLARLMRCEARREVVPIMPKVLRTGEEPMVLLPWDPDYAAAPGEGTPSTHILAQYCAFPSRVKPPKFLRRNLLRKMKAQLIAMEACPGNSDPDVHENLGREQRRLRR